MASEKNLKPELGEPAPSTDLQERKQAIERRQTKSLSELGKTLAELKNGLYRLDRLPED